MAMSKVGNKAEVASIISLNPDTFVSGGGLLDDADVVVREAAFLMWDYNGSVAVAVPALGVTFRVKGEENDPDESKDHDQYYSCGKSEDFVPHPDGIGLTAIGAKTGLSNQSNGGLFIASLINVGVPKTLFDSGNIKALKGLELHVNRVPAPERSNATPRADGRKPEILVATKLLKLPGEGVGNSVSPTKAATTGLSKVGGARPAAAKAPVPVQAATTSAGDVSSASNGNAELDEELTGVVLELIMENGGSLAKNKIAPKVFGKYKGKPNQAAAMKRAASDEFLMGLGSIPTADGENVATFGYDGATLTATIE